VYPNLQTAAKSWYVLFSEDSRSVKHPDSKKAGHPRLVDRSDECRGYVNEMNFSFGVRYFKLGFSSVILFVQKNWFPDNFINCLSVLHGQIAEDSWRHFQENYRVTWLEAPLF
jgi:hypothetical protein